MEKRRANANNDNNSSSAKKTKIQQPAAGTDGVQPEPSTNITDLVDDCLFEVMDQLDLHDLCSIAEVCTQFRNIAQEVFVQNHRNVSFTQLAQPNGQYKLTKVRQLLSNFGRFIANLTFDVDRLEGGRRGYTKVLKLVRKYTFQTIDQVEILNEPSDDLDLRISTMFFRLKLIARDSRVQL